MADARQNSIRRPVFSHVRRGENLTGGTKINDSAAWNAEGRYKWKTGKMKKEEFFRQYAGKYRLVKMVIGKNDLSEAYAKGWRDKSLYMYFEITGDGKFTLKACAGAVEKEYVYYFDTEKMEYHLKEDGSDQGTLLTIEKGVITEKTEDHLMVYELTDELD